MQSFVFFVAVLVHITLCCTVVPLPPAEVVGQPGGTPIATISSAPYAYQLAANARFDYAYVKTTGDRYVLVTLGGPQKCYYAIATQSKITIYFTGSKGCSEIKKALFYASDCSTVSATPTPAATTTSNPTTVEPTTTSAPTTTQEPTTTTVEPTTATPTPAPLVCCGTAESKGPCWMTTLPLVMHIATQVTTVTAADPAACCHACELDSNCAQWSWNSSGSGVCLIHASSVCANPVIPYGVLATNGGIARC